jgi:hypothetical protein
LPIESSKINDTRFIKRYIHKDIFCNIICDWLIKEFNTVNNSHEMPPNIIDINKIPHINYFLLSNFHFILDQINRYYNNNTSIVINYVHIVKYTVFEKVNNIVEDDDSILQIRIGLNHEHSNYDGGKLVFNNMVTQIKKGSMLVFSNNNNDYTHNDILSGEQYVLIAGITL